MDQAAAASLGNFIMGCCRWVQAEGQGGGAVTGEFLLVQDCFVTAAGKAVMVFFALRKTRRRAQSRSERDDGIVRVPKSLHTSKWPLCGQV
jgi:hypothetical protein